ncbi:PREDICTED: uncharacterized protein LOC107347437 [Acropora digitifera]|uniref:uncharacterized protein LOC107347425 n=1 Tax=Acropora digitifera TaxID=70779 RepID=UPI00077A3467|nr:PREDICTED: uncharacterized protein LOC107347425 [Acropora digitifera]XP_015768852.1 PREDICTED: uncharacterized protein LOC107347437 [Acropora digitifera]
MEKLLHTPLETFNTPQFLYTLSDRRGNFVSVPKPDLAESVSFRPETVSEDDVLLIAHELGSLWKRIGLVLKVPKAVISQIESNKSEVFEKCHTVLTSWQERFPYDATYHCLARALKHPAVGREDLAGKYCGL